MVRAHWIFGGEDEFTAFLDEFQHESARAAAVLGPAYLDSLLMRLLAASFAHLPPKKDRLFTGDGPAASFSSRISLAYYCGLITLEERQDLDQIREIRNRFAHELHGWSFDTPAIADRCRNLKCTEERLNAQPALGKAWPHEPRPLFNLGVALLAYYLNSRIKAANRAPAAQPPLWPKPKRLPEALSLPTATGA